MSLRKLIQEELRRQLGLVEEKRVKEINFSPFASNVLDYIDTPLTNVYGDEIIVRESGRYFLVYVNGQMAFKSDDNIEISYFLNTNGAGLEY